MFLNKNYLPILVISPFFLIDFFMQNNIIFDNHIWYGELGITEIISALVLFLGLLISLKSLKNAYSAEKPSFFIRSILFLFLLIEEMSFITSGVFSFTTNYNTQNELNIHNSKFLVEPIGGGGELFGFEIDISLYTIFILLMTIFIAYGSYVFRKNWAKILFLDQKMSSCFLIYPANLIITFFLQYFGILEKGQMFLYMGLTELSLYTIILIDSILKLIIIKYN